MQPVLWTKGVSAQPAALSNARSFSRGPPRVPAVVADVRPWGFQRLEIDREALAAGMFAHHRGIRRLCPTGSCSTCRSPNRRRRPNRSRARFNRIRTSLDVYLGIPEYRFGGHNVSGLNRERDARYRAEELLASRRDDRPGGASHPGRAAEFPHSVRRRVARGKHALRVARVTRSATGEYQLDTQFVPPLIDIQASDYVMAIARRLVEILSAKSTALASTRRQKNQSLAEFGISDVANFWLLYTINTFFPRAATHLRDPARPSGDALPRDARPHRRADDVLREHCIRATCRRTSTTTFRCVSRGSTRRFAICSRRSFRRARCRCRCGWCVRRSTRWRSTRTSISRPRRSISRSRWRVARATFPARGASLLKVSAAGQLETLIRQALPGVTLTYVPNPPSAVAMKLNYHYFLLQKSGAEWDGIARSRNVAAYVPAELVDPQLELIIVLPQGVAVILATPSSSLASASRESALVVITGTVRRGAAQAFRLPATC